MADTLKAYDPSWRDYLAQLISGDARQGQLRSILAQALTGSSGVGAAPGAPSINMADFSPAFPALAGNEAYRDVKQGNYLGGAANAGMAALGAIPLAGGALRLGGKLMSKAVDVGAKGALTPVVDNAAQAGEGVLAKPVDRRSVVKGLGAGAGAALAATILPHANLLAPAAESVAPAAEVVSPVITAHLSAIDSHMAAAKARQGYRYP